MTSARVRVGFLTIATAAILGAADTAHAAIVPICRRAILKEGLKYCESVARQLEKCERKNLKLPQPIDCLTSPSVLIADARAEANARGKIERSCSLLGTAPLGFPNAYCPDATDIDGIQRCLWEDLRNGVRGNLRGDCQALIDILDRNLPPPPSRSPLEKCRKTLLKEGTRYYRLASRGLGRCEATNLDAAIPVDCTTEGRFVAYDTGAESRAKKKISEVCAGIRPEDLGYPNADCPNATTFQGVIDCLWLNPTADPFWNRTFAGTFRAASLAVVGKLRPPVCGDAIREGTEVCDDGAGNSDTAPDACRRDCTAARCGDGVVDAGETCDEATACCSATCTAAVAAGTPCDDGQTCTAGDQCDAAGRCVPTTQSCGNSILEPSCGEECDNGIQNSDTVPGACRTDCTLPRCGDGVIDPNEQCDGGACCTAACQTQPTGTLCTDGLLCTVNDTCVNGACVGTPAACPDDGNACTTSTCDPSAGCVNQPVPDGTVCSVASPCSTGGTCTAGVCSGSPVVCTPLDQCHLAGTCDPVTGICSNPPAPDGTACDDGNPCTTDGCQAGVCTGTPTVCTASDQCHLAGTCDPVTGLCSNPPAPDGTTCNDANACTTGDSCTAGVCGGTATVCTASDQCHLAGTCDPLTGLCSDPPAGDGTTCDDGNLCTTGDACASGTCTGTPVTCPIGQTCDPGTGACI